MARFVALSLIIDIDPDEEHILLGDDDKLPPPASPARQRWLYHETLHLWQQASARFLIRCTEEDWSRMRRHEQGGGRQPDNAVAAEYTRVDADATFSALDLQECLTRYWELQAFDPLTVLTEEVAFRRVDEKLRERRQRFWESPAQHMEMPLLLAMELAGGRNARAFLSLVEGAGAATAIGLFPLAAFFALQTDAPVRFYTRLLGLALQDLESPPLAPNPANLRQTWFSSVRRRADELHLEMFGTGLDFGMDVLRRSGLLEHPGYAYLLERLENFVAQATQVHSFLDATLQQHPGLVSDLERRSRELMARYDDTARATIAAIGRQEGQRYEPRQSVERPETSSLRQQPGAPVARELPTPRWLTEFVVACPQGAKSGFVPGDPTTVLSDHLVPPCIRAGQRIVPSFPLLVQRYAGATELANHCLDVESRWLRFREAHRPF